MVIEISGFFLFSRFVFHISMRSNSIIKDNVIIDGCQKIFFRYNSSRFMDEKKDFITKLS